jgi:hypothetical protein
MLNASESVNASEDSQILILNHVILILIYGFWNASVSVSVSVNASVSWSCGI